MIRSTYYGDDYLSYTLDGHLLSEEEEDEKNIEQEKECSSEDSSEDLPEELSEDFLLENLDDEEDFLKFLDEEESDEDLEEEEGFSRKTLLKTKDARTLSQKIYIDPVVLNEEIDRYYSTGELSEKLSIMLYNIAHKLSFRKNFFGYSYREDMVSDTFCHLLNVLSKKNFDVKKGNSFSYFTKVAFHSFVAYIKKQELHFNNLQEWRKEILAQIESEQSFPAQKNNQIVRQKNLNLFQEPPDTAL